MRVTDWQRWTDAKKKMAGASLVTGIFFSFGVESSLWWALPAAILTYAGCLLVASIDRRYW